MLATTSCSGPWMLAAVAATTSSAANSAGAKPPTTNRTMTCQWIGRDVHHITPQHKQPQHRRTANKSIKKISRHMSKPSAAHTPQYRSPTTHHTTRQHTHTTQAYHTNNMQRKTAMPNAHAHTRNHATDHADSKRKYNSNTTSHLAEGKQERRIQTYRVVCGVGLARCVAQQRAAQPELPVMGWTKRARARHRGTEAGRQAGRHKTQSTNPQVQAHGLH